MHVRSLRVLLTLICGFVLLPAQQSFVADTLFLRSSVTKDSLTRVTAITGDSMVLVSVNDIAKFYGYSVVENTMLGKIEIVGPTSIIKFTDKNIFVSIRERESRRQQILQLAVPATNEKGIWYIQKEDAAEIVRSAFDSTFSFYRPTGEEWEALFPTEKVITAIEMENKLNGVMVRMHATAPIKDFSRSLQIGDWIYVTLPKTKGDSLVLDTALASGIIRSIKAVPTETALQLSFQLRTRVITSELVQDLTSNDLLFSLVISQEKVIETAPPVPEKKPEPVVKKSDILSNIEKQKQKWKLDVIVIDPGHGGHDPGTIGTIGTREKDVTLGIGLKLGDMIEKEMPDVRVVYTRKTDRFVELYRRGQIANEAGGKLFISIHCNSTERKPSNASGFEIYLLRPGKTDAAIKIAEKENAVVKLEKDYEDRYQELTEENFIILTMAQSAYIKQSEQLAQRLMKSMSEKLEPQDQAVRQAGFYVLVGASMPNVLVETGYLSNPKEEKFLRNQQGQKVIAESIVKALKKFKEEYEGSF